MKNISKFDELARLHMQLFGSKVYETPNVIEIGHLNENHFNFHVVFENVLLLNKVICISNRGYFERDAIVCSIQALSICRANQKKANIEAQQNFTTF